MPRWRHSSTSYFGGSNSYFTNSSIEVLEKSEIGNTDLNTACRPSSGQPSRPLVGAAQPTAEPPSPYRRPADIGRFRGLLTPESVALTSHLLEFHLGPGLFQLGLDLLCLVLGHAFLDRLGRTLDQILGLLEAQAGERAHLLDHLDLLVADGGKHGGELGLLFGWRGGAGAAGSRGDGD